MSWGRLCFDWFPGRFPSEIAAEIDRLPCGFLDEMIESFMYARAKATYDAHNEARGGLVDTVRVIEFELAQEEMTGG